jgi:hypothetical protein
MVGNFLAHKLRSILKYNFVFCLFPKIIFIIFVRYEADGRQCSRVRFRSTIVKLFMTPDEIDHKIRHLMAFFRRRLPSP